MMRQRSNPPAPSEDRQAGRRGPDRSRMSIVVVPVAIALLACTCLATGVLVGSARHTAAPGRSLEVANVSPADTSVTTVTTSDPTTTDAGSTTTTTTTAPVDPTVPAPPGYANQLVSLYGEIYNAATNVQVPDQTTQIMSPTDFQSQVDALSPADLAMIYTATSSMPNFSQLSGTFQQADQVSAEAAKVLHLSAVGSAANGTARSAKGPSPAPAPSVGATLQGARPRLALGVVLAVPKALSNYTPTSPVIIYPQASCPNGAPGIDYGETAIFSLQVAVDVISEAVAVIPDGLSTAFGNVTVPNVARIIVAAIQLGVVITHDTFAYLQSVSNDCAGNYLASLAGNTDNSAYQTFELLGHVADTANEIDTNLADLINQDTSQFDQQLTLDIQTALTAPAGTVPMANMELPASLGGYLDSSPVGVNEVVSGAIHAMQHGRSADELAGAARDETLAEQAFSSSEYKLAFDYYRAAYQAAAS